MARQAALNAVGPTGPGGSTPSPSALLSRSRARDAPWKVGHLVWQAASKAVGVLPQGVRFPCLPPSVGRPTVGQRTVNPRRSGASRFDSCPTDHHPIHSHPSSSWPQRDRALAVGLARRAAIGVRHWHIAVGADRLGSEGTQRLEGGERADACGGGANHEEQEQATKRSHGNVGVRRGPRTNRHFHAFCADHAVASADAYRLICARSWPQPTGPPTIEACALPWLAW